MDKNLYIQAPVVKKKAAARPKELVSIKIPKPTAPIQRLLEQAQYKIEDTLQAPLNITLLQYLNKLEPARKELAYLMQSSATRYKHKRIPKATVPVTKAPVLLILQKLPKIIAKMQKDNNKAASIYIIAWIDRVMITDTLVDGGAMVDLVNSKVIKQLPHIEVYKDNPTRIVLADKTQVDFTEYVILPVNVAGVVATTRAHIVPSAKRYKIFLGLRWLRQVLMTINY